MRSMIVAAAALVAIGGAAHGGVAHADDGYRRASGFEQTKSECEFFADQAVFAAGDKVGFFVQPMYHARAFDQCMMAKGYARNQ